MTVIREANEPPIATTTCQKPPALPNSLFARPAEQVRPSVVRLPALGLKHSQSIPLFSLLLKQRSEGHYGQLALLGKLQARWQLLLRAKELRRWGITAQRKRVLAIARARHGICCRLLSIAQEGGIRASPALDAVPT